MATGMSATGRWSCIAAAAGLMLALTALPAVSQFTFNEREVKAAPTKIDEKSGVWVFDFRFKDPRLIKVSVPGRGTRICWYMWYQVINRTGQPRDFNPAFELVTLDQPGVYLDEVLSSVEEEVRKLEDKAGVQDIKNTVEIGLTKIPVSEPANVSYPKAITGVAIWDGSPADAKGRKGDVRDLSDCSQFSIFVSGLSNGTVIVDPPAPGLQPIRRYKTLQLNFERQGERYSVDSRDIKFKGPAEWVYRAESRTGKALAIDLGKKPKVEKTPEKKTP